jgi:Ca2+-binding EF-hand superfamily protein
MKSVQMLTLATAALLASSLALAAPPTFSKADANGDGVVDAEEFAASGIERKFEKLDKNGDGTLDKKEYAAVFDEDCA